MTEWDEHERRSSELALEKEISRLNLELASKAEIIGAIKQQMTTGYLERDAKYDRLVADLRMVYAAIGAATNATGVQPCTPDAAVADVQELAAKLAQRSRERDAALREADRLRHGVAIEGDYVCPDALRADTAERELAEAKASASKMHRRAQAAEAVAMDQYRSSDKERRKSLLRLIAKRMELERDRAWQGVAFLHSQIECKEGTCGGCPACSYRKLEAMTEERDDARRQLEVVVGSVRQLQHMGDDDECMACGVGGCDASLCIIERACNGTWPDRFAGMERAWIVAAPRTSGLPKPCKAMENRIYWTVEDATKLKLICDTMKYSTKVYEVAIEVVAEVP